MDAQSSEVVLSGSLAQMHHRQGLGQACWPVAPQPWWHPLMDRVPGDPVDRTGPHEV